MRAILFLIAFLFCSGAYAAVRPGLCVTDAPARSLAATPATVRAMNNPSITCVALVGWQWSSLEPADGVYNWAPIDAEVAIIKAAGKNYSLGVQAGVSTPDWLYSEDTGAEFSTYYPPLLSACTPVAIGNPLNSTFQAKWGAFVAALGTRYNSDPSLFLVKFSGINWATNETMLPDETGRTIKSCIYPHDTAHWVAAGYTATRIDATYTIFLKDYIAAFPDRPIAVMSGPHSMPCIDTSGNIVPGSEFCSINVTDFFAIGDQLLGANFVRQNNNLMAGRGNNAWYKYSSDSVGLVGWQFSQPISHDTGRICRMNSGVSPCPNAAVMANVISNAFRAGLNSHLAYIEVFPADVNDTADFKGTWAQLLAALRAQSGGSR